MTDKLVMVALSSGIAAVTALAIAIVPLWWQPRGERIEGLMMFAEQWPSRPIEPPLAAPPNLLAFDPPLVIPPVEAARKVATQRVTLVTTVPKTGGPIEVEPKEPKVLPKHDYCWPGRRVDHHRRWRCVYARGRDRRS